MKTAIILMTKIIMMKDAEKLCQEAAVKNTQDFWKGGWGEGGGRVAYGNMFRHILQNHGTRTNHHYVTKLLGQLQIAQYEK